MSGFGKLILSELKSSGVTRVAVIYSSHVVAEGKISDSIDCWASSCSSCAIYCKRLSPFGLLCRVELALLSWAEIVRKDCGIVEDGSAGVLFGDGSACTCCLAEVTISWVEISGQLSKTSERSFLAINSVGKDLLCTLVTLPVRMSIDVQSCPGTGRAIVHSKWKKMKFMSTRCQVNLHYQQ